MLIHRNLAPVLLDLAGKMPVVAVTGPRQSGKTTLCRQTFPDKPYVTLEPLDRRRYATDDPRGFLREFSDGAILDEIQRVPNLLGCGRSRPAHGRRGQVLGHRRGGFL